MDYKESKRLLIADLKSMPDNGKISIFWGDRGFTPTSLAKEIEDETEIGIEHIQLHTDAMNRIAEWKKNPPKKWWQIWK